MTAVAAADDTSDHAVRGVLFSWPGSAPAKGGTPGRDEPLISDRPDFTESSNTVGLGVVQIEGGYTLAYDDDHRRVVAHSFPETLVRIGVLADWLELRVGWGWGWETTTTHGRSHTDDGSNDVYLGMKIGLAPQQGFLPETAMIPQMTVPVGGPLSDDRVLPGLNWVYGWDIIDDVVSLNGETQASRQVDEESRHDYAEIAESLSIGYSLTEQLDAYTEWYMLAPIGADTARTEHYVDAGFSVHLTNDLQFDFRAGKGLNDVATDFFTGLGAVVRF